MLSGCVQASEVGLTSIFSRPEYQDRKDTSGIPSKGPTQSGHYRGIASGDLDGDGIAELISANILTGEIVIWPGRKKGGWAPPASIPTDAEIRSIDLADIDADARLDIIASVRRGGEGGIEVWKNLANLNFRRAEAPRTKEQFDDIHAVDLNFDGRADIIAVTGRKNPRGTVRIWLNLGPNKWKPAPAPVTQAAFHGVTAADLNQDGIIDIIAAGENPGGGIRAWLGKGKNLKWGEGNILARGEFWSVRVEDMNGDNIPDAMATGKETGILIWEGLGKGKMNRMASPVSTGSFWHAAALDRDGDGRVDIVASTMNGNGLRFWKQQEGIGWVAQRLVLPEKGMYQDILVADLDLDGQPDLGSATHGAGIAFWPAFGKNSAVNVAHDGKPKTHHLPLIPGTRLPDRTASGRASPDKTPPETPKPGIEGASPVDRLPGEYVIGSGDTLAIKIWQGIKAETLQVQVSERGLISFGYIDDAQAARLTVFELDKLLTKRLARFIKNPRVEIGVVKFGSKIVRVMGAVARPKTYNVAKTITILDAILMAGGHITNTTRGDLERVKLQREGKTQTVNLLRFISGNNGGAKNPFLLDGDLVFVPEVRVDAVEQPRIYVFGQAKRPGVFIHSTNMRALDAVAKAGGFNEFGLPQEVRIIRGDPERPEVIRADLKALLERGDRRGNIMLQPNDVLVIPRSVIGDMNEFVKQVSPLLDFLFYPARLRDVYSINTNVLKFDVGGPSARKAEAQSDGTFSADAPSTSIVLQ